MRKGIYVFALAAAALFYRAWLLEDQTMIETSIGGIVAQEGSGELNEVELGRWLFLIAVILLICCMEIRNRDEIKLFELYRYDQFKSWWSRHFLRMQLLTAGSLIELYVIWGVMEAVTGQVSGNIPKICLLYWLHMSFLVAVLTMLDVLVSWKYGGILLILAEGVGYLASLKSDLWFLLPGIWGMFSQSDQIRERGGYSIAVVCVIEIAGILLSYFSVELLTAKGKMEKWRIL